MDMYDIFGIYNKMDKGSNNRLRGYIMNKREIIKTAATFISSMAVGTLTSMMIKNNAIPTKLTQKVAVAVGGFVLSDMISAKASEYVEKTIDDGFDMIDNLKKSMQIKHEDILVEENANG